MEEHAKDLLKLHKELREVMEQISQANERANSLKIKKGELVAEIDEIEKPTAIMSGFEEKLRTLYLRSTDENRKKLLKGFPNLKTDKDA